MAHAVTLCRPEVIACYPISPQTHIVETLSRKVKAGEVGHCQFLNVESEFGALSVLIGASAMGARTYTATTSQGLLFMAEAVYNAAGLGLPIVMTIANRALGAPINIWNDHSDSMSMRDSGWIQLYAEDNQEAVDLHIQAFCLAEELSCPVMVCMDGYILTHAYEAVDLPTQEQVDGYVPAFEPVQVLCPIRAGCPPAPGASRRCLWPRRPFWRSAAASQHDRGEPVGDRDHILLQGRDVGGGLLIGRETTRHGLLGFPVPHSQRSGHVG